MAFSEAAKEIALRELRYHVPMDQLGSISERNVLAQWRSGFFIQQSHGLLGRPNVENRQRNYDSCAGRSQLPFFREQDRPILNRIRKRQFNNRPAGSFKRARFSIDVRKQAIGSRPIESAGIGLF